MYLKLTERDTSLPSLLSPNIETTTSLLINKTNVKPLSKHVKQIY